MRKCIVCEKKYEEKNMCRILVEGTDCCTSDPEEEDLLDGYICLRCQSNAIEDPDDIGYGFCRFDLEKGYALHVSDMQNFCCKEHYPETIMDDEDRTGWDDLIENWNK